MTSEVWWLSSEHYVLGSKESSWGYAVGSHFVPMKPRTAQRGEVAHPPIRAVPRHLRELSCILPLFLCVGLSIPQESLLEAQGSAMLPAGPRQLPGKCQAGPSPPSEVPTEGSQCGTYICVLWLLLGHGGE